MKTSEFPMAEAKQKLQALKAILPQSAHPLIYFFGNHLANYIERDLSPNDFFSIYELAVADLASGVNSQTNQKIDNLLLDLPRIYHSMFLMNLTNNANVIFPEDFAAELKVIVRKSKELN